MVLSKLEQCDWRFQARGVKHLFSIRICVSFHYPSLFAPFSILTHPPTLYHNPRPYQLTTPSQRLPPHRPTPPRSPLLRHPLQRHNLLLRHNLQTNIRSPQRRGPNPILQSHSLAPKLRNRSHVSSRLFQNRMATIRSSDVSTS